MPKYRVTATRTFVEHGELVLDAFDEDTAREEARDGMDSFTWDHGTLEDESIEEVEEITDA